MAVSFLQFLFDLGMPLEGLEGGFRPAFKSLRGNFEVNLTDIEGVSETGCWLGVLPQIGSVADGASLHTTVRQVSWELGPALEDVRRRKIASSCMGGKWSIADILYFRFDSCPPCASVLKVVGSSIVFLFMRPLAFTSTIDFQGWRLQYSWV